MYSLIQGKRDAETVLTMGIMEDVSIIHQSVGGKMGVCYLFYFYFLKCCAYEKSFVDF